MVDQNIQRINNNKSFLEATPRFLFHPTPKNCSVYWKCRAQYSLTQNDKFTL